MNQQNVTQWCCKFSEGWTDVHNKQSSGSPSLIPDNLLQETEGEIHANWRVTIRELHHIIPEESKSTIHEAVIEKLVYRKLCVCWVPKMLTDDHKSKQMGSTLKFLTCYAQEGDEFLDSTVTGDEIWGFHHTRRRWWSAKRSHDVVQRAGGRLLWLGDTEAGSKS